MSEWPDVGRSLIASGSAVGEVLLEAVDPAGPARLGALDPVGCRAERSGDHAVVGLASVPHRRDEAGVGEHAEVLGDRLAGDGEFGGEVGRRGRARLGRRPRRARRGAVGSASAASTVPASVDALMRTRRRRRGATAATWRPTSGACSRPTWAAHVDPCRRRSGSRVVSTMCSRVCPSCSSRRSSTDDSSPSSLHQCHAICSPARTSVTTRSRTVPSSSTIRPRPPGRTSSSTLEPSHVASSSGSLIASHAASIDASRSTTCSKRRFGRRPPSESR